MITDYPVTTPYGYVIGYPLNNGFHQGIDYGCPVGTPAVVNGVTIGLSGNSGESTGPHCHVGKWLNGAVQNPGVGNGFSFNSAVVTEINEDATNGKYVRVQGDGFSWVYLHLSDNSKVKVGQVLQGDSMEVMTKDAAYKVVTYLYNLGTGAPPTPEQGEYWADRTTKVLTAIDELGIEMEKELAARMSAGATVLKPGKYQVT